MQSGVRLGNRERERAHHWDGQHTFLQLKGVHHKILHRVVVQECTWLRQACAILPPPPHTRPGVVVVVSVAAGGAGHNIYGHGKALTGVDHCVGPAIWAWLQIQGAAAAGGQREAGVCSEGLRGGLCGCGHMRVRERVRVLTGGVGESWGGAVDRRACGKRCAWGRKANALDIQCIYPTGNPPLTYSASCRMLASPTKFRRVGDYDSNCSPPYA